MAHETREAVLERLVLSVMQNGAGGRSQATDALWDHLNDWAPRWLLRVTAWPTWLSIPERADIARDACAHLVLRCCSRDVRIHGMAHDVSAWACTVLRNYVQGQLRKVRKRPGPEGRSVDDGSEPHGGGMSNGDLEEAVVLLESEIVAMALPRFAAGVRHMFHCYLAHRLGVASEPAIGSRRERELLYLHRHRGKVAALKAYQRLQGRGLDPGVEGALRALLGGEGTGPVRKCSDSPASGIELGGSAQRNRA